MSRRRQDVRSRRRDLPEAASIRRRIQNVSLRPERPVRQMHRTLRTQVIIFADVDRMCAYPIEIPHTPLPKSTSPSSPI